MYMRNTPGLHRSLRDLGIIGLLEIQCSNFTVEVVGDQKSYGYCLKSCNNLISELSLELKSIDPPLTPIQYAFCFVLLFPIKKVKKKIIDTERYNLDAGSLLQGQILSLSNTLTAK